MVRAMRRTGAGMYSLSTRAPSRRERADLHPEHRAAEHEVREHDGRGIRRDRRERRAFRAVRRDQPEVEPDVRDRDRKSTRLNSSHLGISYAVFCLKKKKKST